MRELKFRVWDEKYHCWDNSLIICYPNEDFKKQGRTIQLFTGLTDSKGKEIYEGDFIRFEKQEGVWPDQIRTHEVQFPFICGNAHLGEVIGNIFENSELLES